MTHLCRSSSVGWDFTGVFWELTAQTSPDAWERSKYLVMYLHDSRPESRSQALNTRPSKTSAFIESLK